MNFKIISFLLANALVGLSFPHHLKERSEPLSGQGDMTYYGEGGSDPAPTGPEGGSPGACGVAPKNKEYFAALNHIQYGEYPNPNNSVVCGRCVKIAHDSKEVVVEIVDKCPVCHTGDVDLSPRAFKDLFGSLDIGRVHNVKWHEVSCDELKNNGSSSSYSSPSKNILPGNMGMNMESNKWENNEISYEITTKTIPRKTTKTLPRRTSRYIPKITNRNRNNSNIVITKTRNLPTPITISTTTVITTVLTIPITTVITDYNYYKAMQTNIPPNYN